MSSIYKLIVREHTFLPINTKTLHFTDVNDKLDNFRQKCQFGPVPTEIIPGGVRHPPHPPVGTGLITVLLDLLLKKSSI